MKYIKTFESMNIMNEGDYALFYYDEIAQFAYSVRFSQELKELINNNIGKIKHISNSTYNWISVEYDNIPSNLQYNFHHDGTILLDKDNVVEYAKTKEELEIKLSINKYNL